MKKIIFLSFLLLTPVLPEVQQLWAAPVFQQQEQEFTEYRGRVINSQTGGPIASAQLSVDNTNIATVTNSEGEFSLKIPAGTGPDVVRVSYLGYESKKISLYYFSEEDTEITLEPSVEDLDEVTIFDAEDPVKLVRNMLSKRGENYMNHDAQMTAFYRETIRKGQKNVSLSEAVIKLHKKPYTDRGNEDIELVKSRKTADYDKLDTMALKLRGGPYNALFIDMIKYPDFIFYENEIDHYEFEFGEPTRIDDRFLYVVNFEDRNKDLPWYYGQLFIDAETHSLVRASFNLNVDNRQVASRMFVSKKPGRTKVYPVDVHYEVDYQQQDGRWFYGYGSARLEFVVNWKRKLFNSRYHVHSEMAVTGWERGEAAEKIRRSDAYLKPSVVMADDAEGFSDPAFWGSNNIIEPDKSIQNAIEKIQRQLQ